jgi:hypothetical protein
MPAYHFLTPEYDIIQGIHTLRDQFPIPLSFHHVNSHQDQHRPFHSLPPLACINILADQYANEINNKRPHRTGLFPSWIPGTMATLVHNASPITKHISAYIRTATHAPAMKEYLIDQSINGHGRTASWDNTIFESIAWQPLKEVYKKKVSGQRIQISKLLQELLATARCEQVLDNKNDGRCFICNLLWEDTNHVIRCCGDDHTLAHTTALTTFCLHLQ